MTTAAAAAAAAVLAALNDEAETEEVADEATARKRTRSEVVDGAGAAPTHRTEVVATEDAGTPVLDDERNAKRRRTDVGEMATEEADAGAGAGAKAEDETGAAGTTEEVEDEAGTTECPICMETFAATGRHAIQLPCCDKIMCHKCMCTHYLSPSPNAHLCPFCRQVYASGPPFVITFERFVCTGCNGVVPFFNKMCFNKGCVHYHKSYSDCPSPEKRRFHHCYSHAQLIKGPWPKGHIHFRDGRHIGLINSVLFSCDHGPTVPSSRYVLRPDGSIDHVHEDGSVQAWADGRTPQWFPLMPSTLALCKARMP